MAENVKSARDKVIDFVTHEKTFDDKRIYRGEDFVEKIKKDIAVRPKIERVILIQGGM